MNVASVWVVLCSTEPSHYYRSQCHDAAGPHSVTVPEVLPVVQCIAVLWAKVPLYRWSRVPHFAIGPGCHTLWAAV